jgi:hypothetical protein
MFRAIWDVESEIRNELHPAEVVVWIGQPSAWGTFVFKFPDVLFGLIFVIVGSPALFLANNGVVSIDKPAGIMGIIFPGIFILLGVAAIAGVVFEVIATSRTAYAATDRRLLIVRNMIRRRVTTIARRQPSTLWRSGKNGIALEPSLTVGRETEIVSKNSAFSVSQTFAKWPSMLKNCG